MNDYHTHLLAAVEAFKAAYSEFEQTAIRDLQRAVESYPVEHIDYPRVHWCMYPLQFYIEHPDVIEPIAAITMTQQRLNIPTWQLPMLQGELTYALWQREGVAP